MEIYSKSFSLLNHRLIAKFVSDIWNVEFKRGFSSTRQILVDGAKYPKPIIRWKL